jgi:hypothetical protein
VGSLARVVLPALVALAAVTSMSCANPVAPTATPEAPSAAAQPEPAGVVVLDKPWLPPWSGPNTPPEIAERAGLRFCGVEQGPEVSREIRACFLAEATAGRDIEFARVEPTTEGDPIATVFGFEPGAGLSMAVDSTQDKFGVPAWSVSFCRRIVPDASMVFELVDCVSGPSFR